MSYDKCLLAAANQAAGVVHRGTVATPEARLTCVKLQRGAEEEFTDFSQHKNWY
jgi:hypothetical protein